MKLIAGLFDRLLFAAGLLLFMQLPQFIDHYTQHFAGYWQAISENVANYQASADRHYDGNLELMINDFRNDQKPAMRDMGAHMAEDVRQLPELTHGLEILRSGELTRQLFYLSTHLNTDIARYTAEDFRPGLPLRLDAGICALFGGVFVSGLYNLLLWWPRRLIENRRQARVAL